MKRKCISLLATVLVSTLMMGTIVLAEVLDVPNETVEVEEAEIMESEKDETIDSAKEDTDRNQQPSDLLEEGLEQEDENVIDQQEPIDFQNFEQETDQNVQAVALDQGFITYEGVSTNTNDKQIYEVTVDFAQSSDIVAAIVRTGQNGITCIVKDSQGKQIASIPTHSLTNSNVTYPRRWGRITKPSDATSDICTLTFEVYANGGTSSDGGFRLMVGEISDLEEMMGGINNIMPIAKYDGSSYSKWNFVQSPYIPKDNIDYYKYHADGPAYVCLQNSYCDNMRFEVVESDTGIIVYQSTAADVVDYPLSATLTQYGIGKKIDLENGRDCYIKVYTEGYPASSVNLEKTYNITAGNPYLSTESTDWIKSTPNSISANSSTYKTVKVDVTSVPESAVVKTVRVTIGKTSDMGDYVLTSPNGVKISGKSSAQNINVDLSNFENPGNVKAYGTWTFKFKASTTVTAKPQLGFSYYHVVGDKYYAN